MSSVVVVLDSSSDDDGENDEEEEIVFACASKQHVAATIVAPPFPPSASASAPAPAFLAKTAPFESTSAVQEGGLAMAATERRPPVRSSRLDLKNPYRRDSTSHGPAASGEERRRRDGGYFDRRISKLAQQAPDADLYLQLLPPGTALIPSLFKGVRAYFDGRTGVNELSYLHLSKLFRLFGGQTNLMPAKKVTTHIFCTNLTFRKTCQVLDRWGAKYTPTVLHPRWIIESIVAGRCLNETSFLVVDNASQGRLLLVPKNAQ